MQPLLGADSISAVISSSLCSKPWSPSCWQERTLILFTGVWETDYLSLQTKPTQIKPPIHFRELSEWTDWWKKSVELCLLKSKAANQNAFLCQEILCTVKFNQKILQMMWNHNSVLGKDRHIFTLKSHVLFLVSLWASSELIWRWWPRRISHPNTNVGDKRIWCPINDIHSFFQTFKFLH